VVSQGKNKTGSKFLVSSGLPLHWGIRIAEHTQYKHTYISTAQKCIVVSQQHSHHGTHKIFVMFAEMSKCVHSYKANPDI